MVGHATPLVSYIRKDEQSADALGTPAEARLCNGRCEPGFLIVLPKRRFDRRQLGLDLDDEQHTARCVPREQVD